MSQSRLNDKVEVWKELEENPRYKISNFGRIKTRNKSFLPKKAEMDEEGFGLIPIFEDQDGDRIVNINRKTRKVKLLVIQTFSANHEDIIHEYKNGFVKVKSDVNNPRAKRIRGKNRKETLEFDSVKSASEFVGARRTAISNCLNKKAKTSFGYMWEYCDE